MMRGSCRLVLIDGITGSGKTTAAQYICDRFNDDEVTAVWYHEEQSDHPLTDADDDIEAIQTMEKTHRYLHDFLRRLRGFVASIRNQDRVSIIESYYFQNTIRIAFQNRLPEPVIRDVFQQVNAVIAPVAPFVVYLRAPDVPQAIRQIWRERGEQWKRWFVTTDAATPWVRQWLAAHADDTDQSPLPADERGAIALWTAVQDLTDTFIREIPFPQICCVSRTPLQQLYSAIKDIGLKNR